MNFSEKSSRDWRRLAGRLQKEPVFLKNRYAMNSQAVNIVRALKATKITSRLNLRIRRSYNCAQVISPPLIGVRFLGDNDPSSFTYRPS
jgi:hypothetical protein